MPADDPTSVADRGPLERELQEAVDRAAVDIVLEAEWDERRIERLEADLALIADAAGRLGCEDLSRRAAQTREKLAGVRPRDGLPAPDEELRIQAGIVSLQRMLAAASAGPPPEEELPPPKEEPPPQASPADEDAGSLAADRESLEDFILESREHFGAIDEELLALEERGGDEELVHALFRRFHTIKGLAGFLDLEAVREVAHAVENVLGAVRDGRLSVAADRIDCVLEGVDCLRASVDELERSLDRDEPPKFRDHGPLTAKLRTLVEEGPDAAPSPKEADDDRAAESSDSGAAADSGSEARPGAASDEPSDAEPDRPAARRPFEALRVHTAKLDYLVETAGELVIAQSMVRHDPALQDAGPELAAKLSQLSRLTQEIQTTAMGLRLVPIGQLFDRVARLVRDTARRLGKTVRLERSGADVEVDKAVVERLADPLLHLVRNAVDHGVEAPHERAAAGKPAEALVAVRAMHQSGHIVVEIADDGRGIDPVQIVAAARARGALPPGDEPTPQQARELIFEPGFSTSAQVTEMSGRGVGLDVVKRNILALRGRVEVDSEPGRGTLLRMTIPLTLALIDGLVVGVADQRYIVPLFAVQEMVRPTPDMLSSLEGRDEMALIRGKLLPVVRLHRRFGVEPRSTSLLDSLLVVAESGSRRFCLAVDEFLGKQEVVIKTLGGYLSNTPGVSGGAILGDGRVGLILDLGSLCRKVAHA